MPAHSRPGPRSPESGPAPLEGLSLEGPRRDGTDGGGACEAGPVASRGPEFGISRVLAARGVALRSAAEGLSLCRHFLRAVSSTPRGLGKS